MDAVIQSFHCKFREAGHLVNGLPEKVTVGELNQTLVDAWLLRGTLSLVQWLEDKSLSSNLKQSFHDALPELEKAFLAVDKHASMPSVESYLSRILPLLVRCISMREQYSVEPMALENQTQLTFLLDKIRKGTGP